MAATDPGTIRELYSTASPHKVSVFGLKGITTGDTLDLSVLYSKVQSAVFVSLTSVSNGLPTIAGTTITFAQNGLNNDSGILLVVGGWA